MTASDIGAIIALSMTVVVLLFCAAAFLLLLIVHVMGLLGIGEGTPWTKTKRSDE